MRVLSCLVSLILVSSWLQALESVEFRVDVLDPGASAGRKIGGKVPWEIGVRVGERKVPVTAGVYLDSSLPAGGEGAQGWSLSLEAEACFQIVGATTEGTAGGNGRIDPAGKRDGGFEKTEIVDPGANRGRHGVVTAVVLDFAGRTSLEPGADELILKVTGRVDASSITAVGQRTRPCELMPLMRDPYLQGSGRPVETIVTVEGESVDVGATAAEITLKGTSHLFRGEFRVDIMSPGAHKGERSGSSVPWEIGVPVDQDVVSVEAGVRLVSRMTDQDAGVEAWSISLLAEPCFEVVDATTDGTVAARAPDGLRTVGFETTEIVNPAILGNDGRGGVVSAVILAFGGGVTLDPRGDDLVLKVTGDMDASSITAAGQKTAPCGIFPLSSGPWLRGNGQPVETVVTVLANSIAPPAVGTVEAAVRLKGSALTFEGEYRVDVLHLLASPGPRSGDTIPWTLPVAAGSGPVSVRTGVHLVSEITSSSEGAEAWSLSVETEDCFRITSATTAGTVAADLLLDPAGKRFVGFERTEVVDPTLNGGRNGVVSAVILSIGGAITLDRVSDELILRITGDMDTGDDRLSDHLRCTIRPLSGSGLWGTGQPVVSLVTVEGQAFFARGVAAEITLDPSAAEFRRGDANNDGSVNIADALTVLGFLFSGEPILPCRDAADVNDRSGINIADGVYLFNFLFSGGPRPPAPGPFACGPDSTEDDDLECAEYDC